MTDFKLSIRYQSLGRPAFVSFCLAWALVAFGGAFVYHMLPFQGLTENGLVRLLVLVLGLPVGILYAFVAFSVMLSYVIGSYLYVSKSGLYFSPLISLTPGQHHRAWTDLLGADVKWSGDQQAPVFSQSDQLLLRFKKGGNLVLKLSNFKSRTDLEQLLLAIEVWGASCVRTQNFLDFQEYLQNQSTGVGAVSYTQMWEEELSRRFSSTTFVPHEPGLLLNSRYTICRQLAFGGFSAVYLAQKPDGEMVVIKEAVVKDTTAEAIARAQKMFDREAALLSRLDHPQIAHLLDTFAEGGRHYMVLQYIPGQNLRQYVLGNGPQSEQTVIEWGLQMADMLAYLEAQEPPLVHRDFTPDNLVLREDGKIVLIDFGAANEFVGTATGTLVGKQCYMAPEQVRGKAVPQSDLYALGGTLYFALTGNDPKALSCIDAGAAAGAELTQLIKNMTALDVEQRTQTAQAVAESLSGARGVKLSLASQQQPVRQGRSV